MTQGLVVYSDELDTGLFPSQNTRQGLFWKDGRNVVFEEGAMKAGLGQYGLFYTETVEPIMGIKSTLQKTDDGAGPLEKTIYYGTPTALMRWNAIDGVEDRSNTGHYTGTDRIIWSFARWGEFMLASNGIEPIQIDKNDGNGFIDLVGPEFDWAKIIYATDQQVIAMNTSFGHEYIAWCDVDDVEDWTATTINQAGEKPQRNLDSEIIAAVKLADGIGIYTENEMLGQNYIGTPFVFGIVPLLEGVGVTSKAGIVNSGARHYGFGRSGIFVTDGSTHQRIDSPQVHQLIYGDSPYALDQNYADLVVGWDDRLQSSIVFYYTPKGETRNTMAVSYNYGNPKKPWTLYDYGRTFVDDSGVFPFALSGDYQGNIFQQSAVAAPPQSGSQGTLLLDNEEIDYNIGYGEIGYGDMGYGE